MTRLPAQLWIGAVLSVVLLAAALISFLWTPYDVTALNIADKLKAPSAEYLLGTDHFGRDLLSMLMEGRTNLDRRRRLGRGDRHGRRRSVGPDGRSQSGWLAGRNHHARQ